ncbi:MAG: TetR/AcrR family transcriptional regulator [Gammaproteobacteria bacterium]|nr:TetR/AcrR family transcriptional regulator [Gammaproteobacteria bacterium]
MPGSKRPVIREQLVDAALALAERQGWEAVRLHQVAAACGVGLDAVRAQFPEKDDLIDAWLDRADAAMLQRFDRGGVDGLPPRERIRKLILVWLEALAPHRRVTREMIRHKMEPGHIHVQFPALLRISRTVQWIREGALLDAPLPRRALEETAMTALFVKTFLCWLGDDSEDFSRTRRRLDRNLYWLESAARLTPGGRFGGDASPARQETDPEPTAEDGT